MMKLLELWYRKFSQRKNRQKYPYICDMVIFQGRSHCSFFKWQVLQFIEIRLFLKHCSLKIFKYLIQSQFACMGTELLMINVILWIFSKEQLLVSVFSFCLFSFFFFLVHKACGILVPWPGLNLWPLQWKHGVPTTGPPGNSPFSVLLFFVLIINSLHLLWVEFSLFFVASY